MQLQETIHNIYWGSDFEQGGRTNKFGCAIWDM